MKRTLDFFDADEMKTRVHKDILKNLDDYFIWGKKDLKRGNNIFKRFQNFEFIWSSKI